MYSICVFWNIFMRTGRISGHELLRLLAQVSTPVYVLDDQRRIVYLNQATADWLNVSADELLHRQCRYQSGDPDRIAATADALCPPPEVFQGHMARAAVGKLADAGVTQRRLADFIPLREESDRWAAVLVVVDGEAIPADAQRSGIGHEQDWSSRDESQQLHELLWQFRRQAADRHQIDRIVGRSSAMVRVREQVKLAASGNSTVLIVGPPGIGRQHVARTIHFAAHERTATTNDKPATADQRGGSANHSGRSDDQSRALVPIACAVLTSEQLRSTIWSLSERTAKGGRVAQSTVVLTDVDLLTPESQPEVLRWLDHIPSSLRVLATARQMPDSLVNEGGFNADLARRLSTLVIELPPLADRRDDLPLLAQMFLEELNAAGGKQLRGFATEAMDRLSLYDWPGQIDELAAMVRQSFSQAEGYEITSADLPKQLRLAAEAARHPRPVVESIDLEKFLTQVEAELIERALRQSKRNKSQAARLLGMTRPRLYRRMVQLGLAEADEE
jgi:DNA-binding NtrC family response regulator